MIRRTLICLIILVALLALSVGGVADAQTINPFIQISGSSLTYAGQTIVLRGENFPNLPALDAWQGAHGVLANINTDETDYQALQNLGGNHARLGLNYRWYHDNRAQFFIAIDQQVAWAKAHHVWVIPVLFTTPNNEYEGYQTTSSLWGSSSQQDALNTFWTDFALHYRNEPTVAGYDLLNEPKPPQGDQWYALVERLCNSIAGVDVNHFVIVESTSDPTFPRLLNCPRIVYSVHLYSPISFTTGASGSYPGNFTEWDHRSYPYNAQTIAGQGASGLNDLQTRYSVNWARAKGVPLYIGEWGARAKAQGSLAYIADMANAFNSWGVNYAHYDMRHNPGEWGIYPSDGPLATPSNPGLYSVMAKAFQGSVQPDSGNTPPVPTIVVAAPTLTATISPTVQTPPPTNTPSPAPTAIVIVPTLTPQPCPGPITVSEVVNGVPYTGTLTAVCQQ